MARGSLSDCHESISSSDPWTGEFARLAASEKFFQTLCFGFIRDRIWRQGKALMFQEQSDA